jgi:hypothetical protein
LIRELVGESPQIHWVTSDGGTDPDDVIATAENR